MEGEGTDSAGVDFVEGVGDRACTLGLRASFSTLRLLSTSGESNSPGAFSFTLFPLSMSFILSASSSKST